MINQLYTFSVGQYVVADEWNANFSVINDSNSACATGVVDANAAIMFPASETSALFAAIDNSANSFFNDGRTLDVMVNCEYYENLSDSDDLTISVGHIKGESRIILHTGNTRSLCPISFNYIGGATAVDFISDRRVWGSPGYKFIFLYEFNNRLNVRMTNAN